MKRNFASCCLRFSCFVIFVILIVSGGCITIHRTHNAAVEPRQKELLTEWQFAQDTSSPGGTSINLPSMEAVWSKIAVPHVFRQSALPDESAGWYRRTFKVSAADKGERFYLYLEGAASVKDVFVNGKHVGNHRGAYTASAFDMTGAIEFGKVNTLLVRVSNRNEEAANCLSRSTLYYVNGGLYRKAWLIKTGAVHIYPDLGSNGVYLLPSNISAEKAELNVRTVVQNPLERSVDVTLRHIVNAPDGKECTRFETQKRLEPNEKITLSAAGVIEKPKIWDINQPNLYTVRTELSADGKLSDVVTEQTGFRTIIIKDNKFYLNESEFRARGVNKHHQNEHKWNALSDEELRQEWDWMIEMGCNMVRLAHYPHSRLEYSISDEKGIAMWAENGLAGQLWGDPGNEEKKITTDGERITREMVRQNFNHPSIIFWSCGNETISEVASYYATVIRQEDTSRLVAYASSKERPQNCDVIAFNTYDGWYGGHYTDFKNPTLNTFVSETGAGLWITHHIPYGVVQWTVDKFESEEYAGMFTEFRLQTAFADDAANRPMFLWWNFREFYNLKFKRNRNTKGIVTLAGARKDIYYLFQAFMRPDYPVLHICGSNYFLRQLAADNGIKVYSNAAEVELFLNGTSAGKLKNGDYRLPVNEKKGRAGSVTLEPGIKVNNVFFWKMPLRPGRNIIVVQDNRGLKESMVIYQKPTDGPVPADDKAIVVDLKSSNPDNPAVFIDRPAVSQGPFYYDVDGSSDNTFDTLPPQVNGACWISTRRLSDAKMKTDLSFRLNAAATIYVICSTGTYPNITLRNPNVEIQKASASLAKSLASAGFRDTNIRTTWRGHDLVLADCALWSRPSRAGDIIKVAGHSLDYVILIKSKARP